MGSLLSVIIQLISGAVGGNIAGSLLKKFSLGTAGNSIVGILGGGLGAQLLNVLGVASSNGGGGTDIGQIIASIVGGGVGGILPAHCRLDQERHEEIALEKRA